MKSASIIAVDRLKARRRRPLAVPEAPFDQARHAAMSATPNRGGAIAFNIAASYDDGTKGSAAMTEIPENQIPGIYHRRIGDIIVTALSDGTLDRTTEMLRGIPAEQSNNLLGEAFRPGIVVSVNAFLIRSAGRLVLLETGSGNYLGPTAGRLFANLAAAGVACERIETVLLTHMHPDHSAGLTDPATGERRFPNAELVVHENEPRHWNDDAAMARGSEREKSLFFQQARVQMAPYRQHMRLFREGEVLPGVTAIPCHGHTPGHTAFLLASGDEQLLIWGDTVHIPEVQVPRPDVAVVVDSDPAAAAASRRCIFDMAASERLLVTGMHLHFPGFGYVARRGETFSFVPVPSLPPMR